MPLNFNSTYTFHENENKRVLQIISLSFLIMPLDMYRPANDSGSQNNPEIEPQMIPGQEMTPNRTANDPRTGNGRFISNERMERTQEFGQWIYICYLPGGRSVWEKTVPEVLSTARGRRPRVVLKTKGTVFFPYGPT